MVTEKFYTGYYGFVQDGGNSRYINITNIGQDEVTIRISGDLVLEDLDQNTRVQIWNSDGDLLFDSETEEQPISLIEYGTTGTMVDGNTYPYTIITVGDAEYIFLENVFDPTALPINPFKSGHNPLDGAPSGGGDGDTHPLCFVNGTRILMPNEDCLVEDLRVGDVVVTRDSGEQEVVWTGMRKMTGALGLKHAPIRISADAFGNGLPARDLLVSPQHRILITDWRAELLFWLPDVLVAAKHLINDSTIRVESGLVEFSYHHILFEKHETIFSEGLPTESFHPGDVAMNVVGEGAREELLELFPELADAKVGRRPLSHRALKSFEARAFAAI